MPITPTYPGVYIEEIPSGVRTITGVATSITAFIGRALRGPEDKPARIANFGDYDRVFGGLWAKSAMSYAVQHYFLNGGTDAIIVRVHNNAVASTITLPASGGGSPLVLKAANPGAWSQNLRAIVNYQTKDQSDTDLFNLTIQEFDPATADTIFEESFHNVSVAPDASRFVDKVLAQASSLVKVDTSTNERPAETVDPVAATADGDDGGPISENEIIHPDLETERKGLWALEDADLFNMLVIPPLEPDVDFPLAAYSAPLKYCEDRRAMLIVDAPSDWTDVNDAEAAALAGDFDRSKNAVIYYPRVRLPDPLKENRLETFAPGGLIAGVIARTDAQRGVWKAPAGTEATLAGVRELAYKMTDNQNGRLNPLAVNCLRTFPVIGRVVWGARTTLGADQLASEWKYLPVRRLALFIEESLYRGTQWAVFEPNDEPLWAQLRLNVGGFMHNLFRQGAFQGSSPKQAYLVKCDSETTTQGDIDRGIVNIIVGFAPLKPAEFVILKIQQLAGQDQ